MHGVPGRIVEFVEPWQWELNPQLQSFAFDRKPWSEMTNQVSPVHLEQKFTQEFPLVMCSLTVSRIEAA